MVARYIRSGTQRSEAQVSLVTISFIYVDFLILTMRRDVFVCVWDLKLDALPGDETIQCFFN